MNKLSELKKLIFDSDNRACFIERERILTKLEKEYANYTGEDKYALIFSRLLSEVSTPILPCDYFAGRVIEALPDQDMIAPNRLLCSRGHMSFDYEKVLKIGLCGILDEIKANARKKGDKASLSFAKNTETVVMAIKDFSLRYSQTAEKMGYVQMAKALATVPFYPAYDFYSALQSMWLIHMIASCYVGERDYAFGRFDSILFPYYQKSIQNGESKEDLTTLLAGFMIKTNEICGRTTFNYKSKPVLCQASKQYVNIGGEEPTEFSSVVFDAAMLNNMPQPQITVLLKADANEKFTRDTFRALSVLTDKMNIYNYDIIYNKLLNKGIEKDVAKTFTFSACCTFDLNFHSFRKEYYAPAPQLFMSAMEEKEYSSLEELTKVFFNKLKEDIQCYADKAQSGFEADYGRKVFVLDSILLSDSATECRYACDGNAKYNVLNIFCPGIATIGDSLMVTDKLVFKEKRFTYSEFMDILKNNFENHDDLLAEIKSMTMFGNNSENDQYTVLAANLFADAVDNITLKDNFIAVASFYSLERDNVWREQLSATPNGRKAGEPFSENQSPSYGADKNGITALLQSLAKLPFYKTVAGGLNLTFSSTVPPEILQSLITTYFKMGGLHTGISVIDRKTLEDAMVHPEKYKSLTVRLYGFSEYFVSLPKWQQLAVLNRTQYNY